ncbi:MAG: hypothetical protein EZS28_023240 [Streblomastix strix]|uniref:Uncharacterized protein n=1 Tax=Streblomastix strix TaxID=222440 RepID=A0A5J4VFQ0_9EUKA|nr:MAG: hypothetical protein EZS28_023240 [Streblomastix strix]
MEEERLGMFDGHQIGVQSSGGNWGIGKIPGFYAQRGTLYTSGNAILDLNSTENPCKDNINNNRQSEKQESSSDSELRRQLSIPDAGLVITRERDRVNNIGVQEIWMGDL